jgi:hypothetical protein
VQTTSAVFAIRVLDAVGSTPERLERWGLAVWQVVCLEVATFDVQRPAHERHMWGPHRGRPRAVGPDAAALYQRPAADRWRQDGIRSAR